MAKGSGNGSVGRGGFLKGVAVAGTAAMAAPVAAAAQAPPAAPPRSSVPPAPSPVGERGAPTGDVSYTQSTNCGDFMVDVMKSLGIEYVAAMPGSSFRGLHESIINYGMETAPSMELLTCTHEEASVAMCHGYNKIEGKPMACMMHTTVGLQHGSMAIYNAWADRAAIFMITANQADLTKRHFTVPWDHTVIDGAAIVRDFIKWDDVPASLPHFAESAVRAYQFAMTPPYGPVLLTLDTDMQEDELPPGGKPRIPTLHLNSAPQGESGAVAEAARMLVAADHRRSRRAHARRHRASDRACGALASADRRCDEPDELSVASSAQPQRQSARTRRPSRSRRRHGDDRFLGGHQPLR